MKNRKLQLIILYIILLILFSLTLYYIIHGTIKIMYYLEKYDKYVNNKTTVKKPNNNVVKIYLSLMLIFSTLTILCGVFISNFKKFFFKKDIINTKVEEVKIEENNDLEPKEEVNESEIEANDTIEEVSQDSDSKSE